MDVFLSSTWRELHQHRTKVLEALDLLRHAGFDVAWFGMEAFPASLREQPLDVALRILDQCDVYVGVLGPRYGSTAPGSDISFVEHEYDRACATKEDRALFVMDQLSPEWKLLGEEPDESKRSKLARLRSRFEADRLLNYFDSPSDLALKVVVALLPRLDARKTQALEEAFGQMEPSRLARVPSSVALTASPAVVIADGVSSSVVTVKFTDMNGEDIEDGEPVLFVASGFARVNPALTRTARGEASSVVTPFASSRSGEIYVTCVAVRTNFSGIIRIDYVPSERR